MIRNTLFLLIVLFSISNTFAQKLFSNKTILQLNINTLIVECPKAYRENLKQDINYERVYWKGVKSPFVATYKGNEIGDYHHINFIDAKNKIYDFGFGNNNFGAIKLFFRQDDFKDNPKYLSRKFKVYWKWKLASFPCCDGDYKIVKAYMPSITKLELLE